MGSVGGGSAVDLPSYLSSYALWPPVSPKVCVYVCVCVLRREVGCQVQSLSFPLTSIISTPCGANGSLIQ